MMLRNIGQVVALLLVVILSGCSTVRNPHPNDPLESFNRGVYGFNKQVDKYVLKPVAYVYKSTIPVAIQHGVGNFFSNVDDITTVANDILQLKFGYAIQDATRILINTTFGIGGLIDVASRVGVEHRSEDFGQTLRYWGYENSSYLVLPLLGPSTFRDAIGYGVDRFVLSPWPWVNDDEWVYGLTALNIINTRADLLEKETVLGTIAVDEYSFIRNAYFQRRSYLSEDKALQSSDVDDPFEGFDDNMGFEAEPAENSL